MPTPSRPVSRYQRRILAWGAGVACLLYVVGAPFYLDHIESDLSERVAAELDAAGYAGVTVAFSGQTGSIECREPLSDPRTALEVAYTVRGVRAMEDLPDSCRVRISPTVDASVDAPLDPAADTAADGTPVATTAALEFDTPDDIAAATTTTTMPPDFESVLAVLGGNPQFSLLHQLFQDAGLATDLSEGGPMTLFAPTDAAFDALPADAVAQLRSDPELLARVLAHHLVEGRLLVGQLTDGALVTAAADELIVDAGGTLPRVGGAAIVEPDVMAANGVVHAVDELLLPDAVDLTAPEGLAAVTATFGAGGYRLEGVVRSEVERTILLAAATEAVGADAVADDLTVDPDVGIDETLAEQLATLVAAVPRHLVAGSAGFDGEGLTVAGTYADEAGRTAIEQLAATVGAETALSERPSEGDVAPAGAADLEAELNAFVAANPIRFEPNSATLDESAVPILDEIARRLQEVTGVGIVVEGHTDSDGSDQQNLLLSQLRAVAVQEALVERGLDPASLGAEGFGSTQPVLVDGVEDKDASRRVEFRVVAG